MEIKEILKEISEEGAVSGDEFRLSARLKEIFSNFDHEVLCDKMGNITVHIPGESSKRLMLYTHFDEPGLVVTGVDDKGFLNFNVVGDIKAQDLASQEVLVYGNKTVTGLVGLRPPHILSQEERRAPVTMEELNIDIGFPKDDALKLAPPGTTAVVKRSFTSLQKNKVTGRALRDKAGVAVLYEFLKDKIKLNLDLHVVLGTQHYNEYRGAICTANYVRPHIAIIIDFTEAKNRTSKNNPLECGRGPVIYMGPTAHPKLTESIVTYANDYGYDYQVKASSGKHTTDAWAIQIACGGIATAVLMNPVRYPGSTVEVMDISDLKTMAALLGQYVKHLDKQDWGELLCY